VGLNPIVEHAIRELQLLGMYPAQNNDDAKMTAKVMELVQTFADQQHQGFAAQYCIQMFVKLCSMQPVGVLTGEDGEWKETIHKGLLQNIRCYHVFKDETGPYDANAKIFIRQNGTSFVDANSKVSITFPYVPNPEYVRVEQ
jgi:hypothetical protein